MINLKKTDDAKEIATFSFISIVSINLGIGKIRINTIKEI